MSKLPFKPQRDKVIFLAKKQLPEFVTDAVNLEGIHYTLPEVTTLLDGITVGGHKVSDETITLNQLMLDFYTSNDVGPMTQFMKDCLDPRVVKILTDEDPA